MATLASPAGTFWDRSAAQSHAGGAAGGPSQLTLNHSLGAAPDFIAPVLRSIALLGVLSGVIVPQQPVIGALRGNASINTIQLLAQSAANHSQPTIEYEVYSAVIHSAVR